MTSKTDPVTLAGAAQVAAVTSHTGEDAGLFPGGAHTWAASLVPGPKGERPSKSRSGREATNQRCSLSLSLLLSFPLQKQ